MYSAEGVSFMPTSYAESLTDEQTKELSQVFKAMVDGPRWQAILKDRGWLPGNFNAAANEAVSDPEVRDKLSRLGITPATGTPVQFAAMVAQDAAKWKKIITERKIISD